MEAAEKAGWDLKNVWFQSRKENQPHGQVTQKEDECGPLIIQSF